MSLLKDIIQTLPMHDIDGCKRYFLTLRERKPFNIFVHEIHPTEMGSLCHNHPWKLSISVVLQGGYDEELYISGHRHLRRRNQFSVAAITQDVFHRVVSADRDTWTLFITLGHDDMKWGYRDEFGFYPNNI